MVHFVRIFVLTIMTTYLLSVAAGGQPLRALPEALVFFVIFGAPAFVFVNLLVKLEKAYSAGRYYVALLGLSPLILFGSLALLLDARGFGNAYTAKVMSTGIIWGALWLGTSFLDPPMQFVPRFTSRPTWGRTHRPGE